MSPNKNRIDLVNDPLTIAVDRAKEQTERTRLLLQGGVRPPNPLRDELHHYGLTLDDWKRATR
jgi:hypothetical protein